MAGFCVTNGGEKAASRAFSLFVFRAIGYGPLDPLRRMGDLEGLDRSTISNNALELPVPRLGTQ